MLTAPFPCAGSSKINCSLNGTCGLGAPRQCKTFCNVAEHGAGGFLRGTHPERELGLALSPTEVESTPVLTGGFSPIHRNCPWQYAEYSLRPISRLCENPLRQNCFAHFSEKCLRYFGRGERSLAGARQGRQGQKSQTEPMKCGVDSAPVGLSRLLWVLSCSAARKYPRGATGTIKLCPEFHSVRKFD